MRSIGRKAYRIILLRCGAFRGNDTLARHGLPEVASDDHNPIRASGEPPRRDHPSTPEITAPLRTERIERVATPPRIDFEPKTRQVPAFALRRSRSISMDMSCVPLMRSVTAPQANISGRSMTVPCPTMRRMLRISSVCLCCCR